VSVEVIDLRSLCPSTGRRSSARFADEQGDVAYETPSWATAPNRRARRRPVFPVARRAVKRVASTDTFVGTPRLETSFCPRADLAQAMRELHAF